MELLVNIIGGIALLLWGLRMVRTGITRSFGAELRRALAMSGKNRLASFVAGFAATTLVQSSTATALIVSSFAGRGLVVGSAGLAMMLGADVGTTVIVQALSLDLHWLSPALIAGGVFIFLSGESSRRRALARTAIGLGLMLLALRLIMMASAPLRDSATVSLVLAPLAGEPILAILVVAAVTWLAHSSVAVVLLTMSLASMQVIGVPLALACVLGANLGGVLPAILMTVRAPAPARRIPLGNLAMRAVGVALVVGMLPWIQPYLSLAGDAPARMVANFHTAFNLGVALLFLPLVGLLDRLLRRVAVDRATTEDPGHPRYLDVGSLDTPAVALACAARETLRMGDAVRNMLARTIEVFRTDDDRLMRTIEQDDDVVDRLHEAIKLYLTRLAKSELDRRESERSVEILNFTTNLEHIGDIIDKNLMELAAKKIKSRAAFSPEGLAELSAFHDRIVANLDLALNVFMSGDLELARRLLREKTAVRDMELGLVEGHFARLGQRRPDSVASSALHLDVLRDLKRINSHLTSVAYPILERAGELAASRLVEDARPAASPEASEHGVDGEAAAIRGPGR